MLGGLKAEEDISVVLCKVFRAHLYSPCVDRTRVDVVSAVARILRPVREVVFCGVKRLQKFEFISFSILLQQLSEFLSYHRSYGVLAVFHSLLFEAELCQLLNCEDVPFDLLLGLNQ